MAIQLGEMLPRSCRHTAALPRLWEESEVALPSGYQERVKLPNVGWSTWDGQIGRFEFCPGGLRLH